MYKVYYIINLIQLPGPTLIYLNSMFVHIIIKMIQSPQQIYVHVHFGMTEVDV